MTHPLSQLYYLDQALLRIERKIAQTPGSLDEIALEEKKLAEDEKRRREELEDLAKLIRKMEREGDDIRERIRRGKEKMKELMPVHAAEILKRETGNFEAKLEALELEILENMEILESSEREAQLRQQSLATRKIELEREGANLRKENDEYSSDRDRMAEQRERFLSELELGLRRRYMSIFKGLGYSSIAAVAEGACQGCGARLTPQRAVDIQEGGELGACQGCGRLLIGVEA